MKKILVFSVLALLAYPVKADELLLPGLPGMKTEVTAPLDPDQFQRPDAQRVLSDVSSEIRLNVKQEERIAGAIDRKSRDFDKLLKEYDKATAEEKKWRYRINELKYEMNLINKNMPDVVRGFLDDDQRQTYDAMLDARNRQAAQEAEPEVPLAARTPVSAAPVMESRTAAPASARPSQKKRVLRKKRIPAPAAAPAEPPQIDQSAEGDDAPGEVMVDTERAVKKPAPVARKKRPLKKKTAAPAQNAAPAEEPAAEEDAGSYP